MKTREVKVVDLEAFRFFFKKFLSFSVYTIAIAGSFCLIVFFWVLVAYLLSSVMSELFYAITAMTGFLSSVGAWMAAIFNTMDFLEKNRKERERYS